MTWSVAAYLLLLSGDVELNPGPKKGAPKEPAGPTPEQRITELENKVKTYEDQIESKLLWIFSNTVKLLYWNRSRS